MKKEYVWLVLIFIIGILIGIWIDNYRIGSIRSSLSVVDINSNDADLLGTFLKAFAGDYCSVALEQNLAYNDKIYKDGIKIERKIDEKNPTPEAKQEWRKYTLLQTQFWMNSIELKEKCNFDYHTVVHFFKLADKNNPENKDQSNILFGLKEKCGRKIMLVPITVDMDLITVDAITGQYNIIKYPTVVIDEKEVFQGLTSFEELERIVKC